jgi:hypothetical protein
MKLYSILFEEEQLQLFPDKPEHHGPRLTNEKGPGLFSAPFFSIVAYRGWSNGYALIETSKYLEELKQANAGREVVSNYKSWIAAMGEVRSPRSTCKSAYQVSYLASNETYRAAGYAMYCFLSKLVGEPITSDREGSTSNSAKIAWARIETSGEWTRVFLDNYTSDGNVYDSDEDPSTTYWKVDGTWPRRKLIDLDEPATEDTADDCQLPGDNGTQANQKLGSGHAWIYKGSLNPEPLLAAGSTMLSNGEDYFLQNRQQDIISEAANKLFRERYKGVSG